MIYFMSLQDRDRSGEATDLWQDWIDNGLRVSDFTTNAGISGALFDVEDIYEWRPAYHEYETYSIGERDVHGLRLLPEEPGEGDDDDDDPFEEDDDDYIEQVDEFIHELEPHERTASGTAAATLIETVRVPPVADEEPVVGRFTVRKERWYGFNEAGESNYDTFRPTLAEFAKTLQRNVTVNVPHGSHSALHEDDRFWVSIWSSPDRARQRTQPVPRTLFGREVPCPDPGFSPTDHEMLLDSLTVPLPEGGEYVVAQLFDNDLFIHHDAVHWGREEEVTILQHILTWAAGAYNITPEEREQRLKERRRAIMERDRNTYIEWVKSRSETQLNEAERSLNRANSQVENARRSLAELVILQREAQQRYALAHQSQPDASRYGLEYDKLLQHPDITSVEFNTGTGMFSIRTRNLYAYSQARDTWHDIGEFVINVGQHAEIQFLNQTRRVDGLRERMNHPHVWSNGEACLGNFNEVAANLVAQREYGTLFTMAIEFLKTANEDDSAGRHLPRWPEVDEAVAQHREPEPEETAVAEANLVEVAQ